MRKGRRDVEFSFNRFGRCIEPLVGSHGQTVPFGKGGIDSPELAYPVGVLSEKADTPGNEKVDKLHINILNHFPLKKKRLKPGAPKAEKKYGARLFSPRIRR